MGSLGVGFGAFWGLPGWIHCFFFSIDSIFRSSGDVPRVLRETSMNQIQSLEEQLIAQEWGRLMVELKKASEIVKNALRRYETERGDVRKIASSLASVAILAVGQRVDHNGFDAGLVVYSDALLPTKIPDDLRPLLLSVASRELLEGLRNVPVLIDQVSDLESRQS